MATVSSGFVLSWDMTSGVDSEFEVAWSATTPLDSESEIPWAKTTGADAVFELPWSKTAYADVETEIPWERFGIADLGFEVPWARATPQDVDFALPWAWATPLDAESELPWGEVPNGKKQFRLPWQAFAKAEKKSVLPWYQMPSYVMIENSLTLIRVSDSQEIKVVGIQVGIDVDSWAWQMRAELASRTDAGYVRPSSSGPVEVLLTLNGYQWRFLVEDVSESYAFSSGTYTISGRSPSCVLARPYAPMQTKTYASLTAALSIVSAELVDSGSGYSEDWGISNWVIGGGIYSVSEKTCMDILLEIAKTIGGIVQTDRSAYTLHFLPRYPVSPKNWDGETPDATILQGYILSQSVAWEPKPEYNYVVCSGTDNGVLVHVKRSGTSYDKPAPPIVEPLILTQAVAQERGRNELDASGYNQSKYSMALPLPVSGGFLPLLLPTYLIEVEDLFETWRGMVRGVAISAARTGNAVSVTQTIEAERHWT